MLVKKATCLQGGMAFSYLYWFKRKSKSFDHLHRKHWPPDPPNHHHLLIKFDEGNTSIVNFVPGCFSRVVLMTCFVTSYAKPYMQLSVNRSHVEKSHGFIHWGLFCVLYYIGVCTPMELTCITMMSNQVGLSHKVSANKQTYLCLRSSISTVLHYWQY